MPKFVVSTTLKDAEWNNTTVLGSGDATAQVRKLKEEFDGELQVPGSHQLVQELIESDLLTFVMWRAIRHSSGRKGRLPS